jgi:hypothetical protein
MVNRLDPGDKMGILSKGLSEDNRPRLENFEDNFTYIIKIFGEKVSGNGFSSAASKYFGTQWPSQSSSCGVWPVA